jgi:CrcB protein
MQNLRESLWVGLGAFIGANFRYWIHAATDALNRPFPWPTLLINVLGSTLLGAWTAVSLMKGWGWEGRLFFAVGLCGGFTTFSTFSLEVIKTFYERGWRLAAAYAFLSLALCVFGCLSGSHLARMGMEKWHAAQTSER